MKNKIRHAIFFLIIGAIICVFISRLIFLQVIKSDLYKSKAQSQLQRIIKLYPHRGHIFDRNQHPLALTKPSYSIYAVPHNIENKWEFSKAIAPHLLTTRKELSDKLYATKKPFLWIKRHVSEDAVSEIKKLGLQGVGFIPTETRIYPNQSVGAHLLGFVGIDNQGLGGLEYKYDPLLKGSEGKIIVDGDPRGNRLISGQKETIPPADGGQIITTIDYFLQYSTEKYLSEAVKKHQAKSGQAIIMDCINGDILAMASVPTFNPNQWQDSSSTDRRIRSVLDIFEPGSTFKLITLAAVLEEGIVSPKTSLHVPETYKLYNRTISEAHDRDPDDPDTKTVTAIMEESLNVGTTLLALKLGEERFYRYMKDFGFDKKTGIELPGESKGLLRHVDNWSGVDIGTMSFGQGVAVTGIQLAAALSAIANDGLYVKPRIVHYVSNHEGASRKTVPIKKTLQVISPETSYQVRMIMESIVENGTGKSVRIPGYRIGGKTGTAQKAKENGLGYEPGAFIASFVGLFPIENPRFVIVVAVDTPRENGYYGSTVAGPVFKKVAKELIDYYNIAPEKEYKKRASSRHVNQYSQR